MNIKRNRFSWLTLKQHGNTSTDNIKLGVMYLEVYSLNWSIYSKDIKLYFRYQILEMFYLSLTTNLTEYYCGHNALFILKYFQDVFKCWNRNNRMECRMSANHFEIVFHLT